MTTTPGQRPSRRDLLVVGLLVAVAIVLRLLRIGAREAWLDEACTSLFAQTESPGALFKLLAPESHPPLYYLLMQGWVAVFGAGEMALRLPSLLAGLALVPLAFVAVRRFGGGRLAAWLAAGLAACSPLLVYYGVEAKAYTLLWSLGFGVLLALHRASDPDERRPGAWWLTAASLTVAALYTHHFALFLLPLWALAVLGAPRGQRARGLLAGAAALALYAPWAVAFLFGQAASGGTAWLADYWHGPLAALGTTARVMALAPPFPPYLGELGQLTVPTGVALLAGICFGAPLVPGLAALLRPRGNSAEHAGDPALPTFPRRALPVAAVLLPTVGAALVSIGRPLYLPGRYELLAYPAWIVLWALGVQAALRWLPERRRRCAAAGAVLASAALAACSLAPYLARPSGRWHHAAAAAYLRDSGGTDDAIVAVGLTRAPLEHQLRNIAAPQPVFSFPPEVARHVGWWKPAEGTDHERRVDATRLAAALHPHEGVWLVSALDERGGLAAPRVTMPLFAALRCAGRQPGPPQVFGRLGLVRFVAGPPESACPLFGPYVRFLSTQDETRLGPITEEIRGVARAQLRLELDGTPHEAAYVRLCEELLPPDHWRCEPALTGGADDTLHLLEHLSPDELLTVGATTTARMVDRTGSPARGRMRLALADPQASRAGGYRELHPLERTADGRIDLHALSKQGTKRDTLLVALVIDDTGLFRKHVWALRARARTTAQFGTPIRPAWPTVSDRRADSE